MPPSVRVPDKRLWWLVYCILRGELLNGARFQGLPTTYACPVPPSGVRSSRIQWPALLDPYQRKRQPHGAIQGGSTARLVLEGILISSDLLKRLNEALTMKDPRTSYFGGIITHWQVSKCQTKSRSYMVLRLKPMGKLITLDKYLSVKQNQDFAWSSNSNLWGN